MRKIKVVEETDEAGITVFHVRGSVITNIATDRVKKLVNAAISSAKTPKIIFNLADVSYMDSFSFGWIMQVYKDIREKNGDFAMCCPNKDIIYMLKLTEFSRVVPAFHSEADAKESMASGNKAKRIMYI